MTHLKTAMIDAQNVSVSLSGRSIITDASLQAAAGKVTTIVGPNGSGKTTFMRALCGDLEFSGTIAINGHDLAKLKPWQAASMRAVLPQATSLSFPYTVREIVRLGMLYGRSGARENEIAHLPEMALERVDLEDFAGRFYQELSGGEQQRVQLARVLCQVWAPVLDGAPRYLLLDEPVSSLDIRHQLVIMRIARDFASAGGGVIAILHDLNLTAMFADQVTVMRQGQVAASGTPAEVLRDDLIADVFGCALRVGAVPPPGMPFVLPQSAA
jgi:iron complex transport system ATP-binding protein